MYYFKIYYSADPISIDTEKDKGCQNSPETNEAGCQTTLTVKDMKMNEEYTRIVTLELSDLNTKLLDIQINQDGFRNDEKTRFYTGFPNFCMLMQVFNFISPYVKATSRNVLTQFQELLLVLMRMKLNVPLQDLSYRFNVSVATASRIFNRWIDLLCSRLQFLIHWLKHEELRSTMPSVFKQNFGDKVAVIIDCFEIFIDRPSSLIARAMTWSNYKHHNTIQFLIGITPQGSVSCITKAWGGRVSDKHITENCGILKKLLPDDIVLADRGFDIAESVGFHQAKLYIPAFTRGKKQLSAKEVEATQNCQC